MQALDRQTLEAKYNNSRWNLLLVAAFTAINVIFLAVQSNSYFLFSAYIPYAMVDFGLFFCGMYPAEYYAEVGEITFWDSSVFVILLIVALIFTALYLISWIFSKKHSGWMIAALAFFVVDTLFMFWYLGIGVESLIDIVFHVWVIVSLALGLNAGAKLKKLPVEQPETDLETTVAEPAAPFAPPAESFQVTEEAPQETTDTQV